MTIQMKVLSRGAVYYTVQGGSDESVDKILKCGRAFKGKPLSSTFL